MDILGSSPNKPEWGIFPKNSYDTRLPKNFLVPWFRLKGQKPVLKHNPGITIKIPDI